MDSRAGAPGVAGERSQMGMQGSQGERGEPGPPGPAGPAGASNVRAFEVTGDTASCQSNEILVSALCQGDGGQLLLRNGIATCSGASGIVGLCIRR
jgi:Collagen triple helix repeat (20 copies)